MKNRGFSLIEMIVVLLLIGLSILIVTPSLTRLSQAIELKSAVRKISATLRYYRSEAVNKKQVYQIFFNSELGEVSVQLPEEIGEGKGEDKGKDEKKETKILKKTYALPGRVHFREIKAEPSLNPDPLKLPSIEFYPNGGSNGGFILIGDPERKGYKIRVHFITGMVEIEEV